jgi:hypothetical protein
MTNQNPSESNAPDLGTLVKPGHSAGAAAEPVVESEPEAIDLTSVGGVRLPSPPAGGEPVDLSSLYGPFGGPVE